MSADLRGEPFCRFAGTLLGILSDLTGSLLDMLKRR